MRKFLVLGAAMVALFSLVTIAQGDNHNEDAHVWFFGDCQILPDSQDGSAGSASFLGNGCRGIGIFVHDWDNSSIASEIANRAMDEFGGYWSVEYLKAINLFGGEKVVGSNYGCSEEESTSVTPSTIEIGGLWIALFSVEPCDGYYDDN